jgi:UDP-N-acetylmuramate--alanine ligase
MNGTGLNSTDTSYHFIGIGGIGMSAIAGMLLRKGCRVSGSDVAASMLTSGLASQGAKIYIGHARENIKDKSIVIYSSAILENNPEMLEARSRNLLIIQRAELLGRFFNAKKGIAVSGTHGKTTTTTLLALILQKAGLKPDAFIGGEVPQFGGNIVCGDGDYVVAEADESDGSLLHLHPFYSIVTNIEGEHFGYFKDIESIVELFRKFINQTSRGGTVYLNIDNENTRALYFEYCGSKVAYSMNGDADVCPRNVMTKSFGSKFEVLYHGKSLGKMELNIPGLHNVSNSLAAIALASDIGIDFATIRSALFGFHGVKRRFEVKGDVNGILIIDDYAHHPTEIMATVSSARTLDAMERLIVIFQPHRYSRTMYLREQFAGAFHGIDELILTDVYSACEEPIEGISGKTILDDVIKKGGKNVSYIANVREIPDYLSSRLRPGDVVITMGAGNISAIADMLVERLKKRTAEVR